MILAISAAPNQRIGWNDFQFPQFPSASVDISPADTSYSYYYFNPIQNSAHAFGYAGSNSAGSVSVSASASSRS